MDEISADEQARLEKALRKHRKSLSAYPNVHNVDVGFEYADGSPTGRLALRVHVTEKKSKTKLKRVERVPDDIDGIPVDVIQYNPEPHLVRTDRFDPLRGGVQMMNTSKTTAGTLGMIVFDRDSLQPLALSNWHVMLQNPAQPADVMAQPSGVDVMGGVLRYDRALDCAVCVLAGRTWSLDLHELGTATGLSDPRLGAKVIKSGLTTGVTWGVVEGVNASTFTIVPDDPAMPEISLGGDSGSVWINRSDSLAVGLHRAGNDEAVAGGTERATAVRMIAVTDKLKVLVFDGLAVSTAWIGGTCRVLARTAPNTECSVEIRYPSGRRSSAAGLAPKRSDSTGWVEWTWRIGTSTARKPGIEYLVATVTLGGATRSIQRKLEGHTSTEH
ncbi:hypothetical protein [Williamsia sp. 1135]|uniref:hypothetical protein n=1 Tax=Williamsia sp. 1135 TaxID=1889262 RepID=UPI000A11C638|nr:hypothetical protein [Williamsia sp. 1135]ORM37996.1 hypothetical protein BFL43_01935 [Williamsia sp. 1135]